MSCQTVFFPVEERAKDAVSWTPDGTPVFELPPGSKIHDPCNCMICAMVKSMIAMGAFEEPDL